MADGTADGRRPSRLANKSTRSSSASSESGEWAPFDPDFDLSLSSFPFPFFPLSSLSTHSPLLSRCTLPSSDRQAKACKAMTVDTSSTRLLLSSSAHLCVFEMDTDADTDTSTIYTFPNFLLPICSFFSSLEMDHRRLEPLVDRVGIRDLDEGCGGLPVLLLDSWVVHC